MRGMGMGMGMGEAAVRAHHVFEDERERVLRVHDVVQGDDVRVLELLEKRDLADRRARRALLVLEPDLQVVTRHARALASTRATYQPRDMSHTTYVYIRVEYRYET